MPSSRASRFLPVFLLVSVSALAACVEQDDDKPSVDDMEAAKQNVLTTAPTPRYPVNADLDGKVVYLGLDVDPVPVEPGKDVTLTHYWKLVASPGDGWRTFTHVEGPGKQSFINADHTPVRGKYPVGAWKAGDIVRDAHTIRLPPNWMKKSVPSVPARTATFVRPPRSIRLPQ